MVTVLKYLKLFLKLILIVMMLILILTYQNNISKRKRVLHYDTRNRLFERTMVNVNILIWRKDDVQLNVLKKEHEALTETKCLNNNCYVTTDRNMFNGDYRNFDAILISGKALYMNSTDVPRDRFPKQKFIFASRESADNYPVCDAKFEDYFNLTWTYKLNSDVLWPYFNAFDEKGEKVAPKIDVTWLAKMSPVPARVLNTMKRLKTLGVAWFASNCHTNSKRENFVLLLKIALKKFGVEIDAVGECGTRECPIAKEAMCMDILKQYYFYLAFENSICEDYVTERILKPLLHYTVPVVYGGANYSRFLPPHSYIDAYKLGAKKTAATMAYLIANQTAYLEYFRWRNHYDFKPSSDSICNLCEYLNRSTVGSYREFRSWWNPKYEQKCQRRNQRLFRHHAKSQKKAIQ